MAQQIYASYLSKVMNDDQPTGNSVVQIIRHRSPAFDGVDSRRYITSIDYRNADDDGGIKGDPYSRYLDQLKRQCYPVALEIVFGLLGITAFLMIEEERWNSQQRRTHPHHLRTKSGLNGGGQRRQKKKN